MMTPPPGVTVEPVAVEDESHDTDAPTFALLSALLARPELLAPPECVLPRLAYRARAVLLAAPDKAGKSSLAADGAATLTLGRSWLGEPTTRGRVVWLGLEEALGDAVRRFSALGADPSRVQLVTMTPPDLLERTSALLDGWPADLLVVDSLAEYARVTCGQAPDDGDAAGWGAVVRPLVALARAHGIAVLLLHHVRRSDGQARGSSEILAAVDATLEMLLPSAGEDPTTRRIRGRGRWPIEPVRLALRDGRYELASGAELSPDALVLIHVEREPGTSRAATRRAVQARASVVDAAIGQLIERGAIVDRGTGSRSALYPTATDQLDMDSDAQN
jgi:hypothetical protein